MALSDYRCTVSIQENGDLKGMESGRQTGMRRQGTGNLERRPSGAGQPVNMVRLKRRAAALRAGRDCGATCPALWCTWPRSVAAFQGQGLPGAQIFAKSQTGQETENSRGWLPQGSAGESPAPGNMSASCHTQCDAPGCCSRSCGPVLRLQKSLRRSP